MAAPPSYPQQPNYFAQPSRATPSIEAPSTARRGFTFEANVGVGYVHINTSSSTENTPAALAGLDLGAGSWLTPKLALTLRLTGVRATVAGDSVDYSNQIFIGPTLQYWLASNFWIGGGVGFASFRNGSGFCSGDCGSNGLGLDARVGYSVIGGDSHGNHSLNVSLELNPGFYGQNGGNGSGSATGVGLLIGYQYL